MSQVRRLAFVTTAMGCGGAERVLATLANFFASRSWQVALCILHEPDVFFPLHPAVGVRAFASEVGEVPRWQRPFRRVRWLRRELDKLQPHAVVSFLDVANVMTLCATLGRPLAVIVSERIHPRHHRLRWPYRWLRRVLYRRAAAVVVQTARIATWARRFLPSHLVVEVPNPVMPPSPGEAELQLPPRRWLVGVGRLHVQKGFDVLIEAFATLAPRHPDWSLLILGEGPERPRLEALAARRGLGERVRLPGTVRAVAPVLRQCELFVLSSRYEGFPNALCEALACGLPAVAFDCPTGPREILRDGVDGLLVADGDAEALTRALDRLMGDEAERRRLASRAPEILRRFDAGDIFARWEALVRAARCAREES